MAGRMESPRGKSSQPITAPRERRRGRRRALGLIASTALLVLLLSTRAWSLDPTGVDAQEPPPHGSVPTSTPAPPEPPSGKPTPAPPGIHIAVAPPNDNFAAAIVAGTVPFRDVQNTADATVEAGEPLPCGSIGKTVWYNFTPAVTGTYQVATAGSGFDTVIAIYTGATLGTLVNAGGCDDDSSYLNLLSIRQFQGIAGTTYRIQVGGFLSSSGSLSTSLIASGGGSCATNDNFELGVPNTNPIPCWTVEPALGAGAGTWCRQVGGF